MIYKNPMQKEYLNMINSFTTKLGKLSRHKGHNQQKLDEIWQILLKNNYFQ